MCRGVWWLKGLGSGARLSRLRIIPVLWIHPGPPGAASVALHSPTSQRTTNALHSSHLLPSTGSLSKDELNHRQPVRPSEQYSSIHSQTQPHPLLSANNKNNGPPFTGRVCLVVTRVTLPARQQHQNARRRCQRSPPP